MIKLVFQQALVAFMFSAVFVSAKASDHVPCGDLEGKTFCRYVPTVPRHNELDLENCVKFKGGFATDDMAELDGGTSVSLPYVTSGSGVFIVSGEGQAQEAFRCLKTALQGVSNYSLYFDRTADKN